MDTESTSENTQQDSPLLSVKDLALYLRLSERTIWRLYKDGTIPHIRIGGSLRFRLSTVNEVLDRLTTGV